MFTLAVVPFTPSSPSTADNPRFDSISKASGAHWRTLCVDSEARSIETSAAFYTAVSGKTVTTHSDNAIAAYNKAVAQHNSLGGTQLRFVIKDFEFEDQNIYPVRQNDFLIMWAFCLGYY